MKSFAELVSLYQIDRIDVTPGVEYTDRLQFNASNEIIILHYDFVIISQNYLSSHKRADTYECPENKQRIPWTNDLFILEPRRRKKKKKKKKQTKSLT